MSPRPSHSGAHAPVEGTEDWPFAAYQRTDGRTGSRLGGVEGTLELRDGCLIVKGSALYMDVDRYVWVDGGLESPDGQRRWEIGDDIDLVGSHSEIDDMSDSRVVQVFRLPETCPSKLFSTN